MNRFFILIMVIFFLSCNSKSLKIKSMPYFATERHTDEPFSNNRNLPFVNYNYFVSNYYLEDKTFEEILDSFVCCNYCKRMDSVRASYRFFKSSYRTSKWYLKKFESIGFFECESKDQIRYYKWSFLKNKAYGTKDYAHGGMGTNYNSEQFTCNCDSLKPENSKYIELKWTKDLELIPDVK